MPFNSVKFIMIDTVSKKAMLTKKTKMLVSFEVRIERPQQFRCDGDDGTGVLAIAGGFKKMVRVLAVCSTHSCNNLSTSVLNVRSLLIKISRGSDQTA